MFSEIFAEIVTLESKHCNTGQWCLFDWVPFNWVPPCVPSILIAIFLATIILDFRKNYTRKVEIHDAIGMQYVLVAVELKALLHDIENRSDDEVRRKCEELARRETTVTELAKEATMWR